MSAGRPHKWTVIGLLFLSYSYEDSKTDIINLDILKFAGLTLDIT